MCNVYCIVNISRSHRTTLAVNTKTQVNPTISTKAPTRSTAYSHYQATRPHPLREQPNHNLVIRAAPPPTQESACSNSVCLVYQWSLPTVGCNWWCNRIKLQRERERGGERERERESERAREKEKCNLSGWASFCTIS